MSKQIKLTIDKEGNVDFETQGFHGADCEAIASQLAQIGQQQEKTYTEEYYQQQYESERNSE